MSKKKEILELYHKGYKYAEIAKELNCSKSTISFHICREGLGRSGASGEEIKRKDKNRSRDIRRKRKKKAVDYSGGKCAVCGYNRCLAALEFHHVDPTKKEFQICHASSWKRIKKELEKCKLVCKNCHAEIHEKERKDKN